MQVSISKRWLLVSLICCTQLILLLGVGVVAMRGIESRIFRREKATALRDNLRVARDFSTHIGELSFGSLNPYSSDWLILQKLVEAACLPNNGSIMIVDSGTGLLLCHPSIKDKPELFKLKVGELAIRNETQTRIFDAPDETTGWVVSNGQADLVALVNCPNLELQVIARQDSGALGARIAKLVEPFRTVGLASALALTLLTAAASFVILKRYDNQLETAVRRLEHKVYDRSTALMKTRDAVIFGLAKLAESRDNDTGKHLERIRQYVILLARQLSASKQLSDQFIHDLGFASSLHDIGKVGIPDSILLKRGPLTDEERKVINTHAAMGGRCLEAIQRRLGNDDFLEMAKVIAFAHHERWDGNGYPFGLAEDRIPLPARIVAVADVYDALTTKRPYKRAMPHEEAAAIIIQGSGTQFDPAVVEAFIIVEEGFTRVARQLADTELPSLENSRQFIPDTGSVPADPPANVV